MLKADITDGTNSIITLLYLPVELRKNKDVSTHKFQICKDGHSYGKFH